MDNYGQFSGCVCCVETSGVYDWYGKNFDANSHASSPLFYRTATVEYVDAVIGPLGYHTSIEADPSWFISYTVGDVVNAASLKTTLGVFSTSNCWVTRVSNEDHPEAGWGSNIAPSLSSWTEGATGNYDSSEDRLEATVDTSTVTALISTSISPIGDSQYILYFYAKQDEARYVKVTCYGITNAANADAIVDLQTHSISSSSFGDTEVLQADDNWYIYKFYFIGDGTAASSSLEIKLCDSVGGNFDGTAVNDGMYLSSVSLRNQDGSFFGSDLSRVNSSDKEVDIFRYLSKLLYAAIPDKWLVEDIGIPLEEAASEAVYYRGISAEWKHENITASPVIDSYLFDPPMAGNNKLWSMTPKQNITNSLLSADNTFAWFTSAGTEGPIDHPDGVIEGAQIATGYCVINIINVFTSSTSVSRYWGLAYANALVEYPKIRYTTDDLLAIVDEETEMPYIVAVSPHGYPNVWSIQPALLRRYSTEGMTPGDYHEQTESQTAVLRLGSWTSSEVTIQIGESGSVGEFNITVPMIKGSDGGTEFFNKTVSQTYGHILQHSGAEPYKTPVPFVWVNLIEHDAIGSTGIALFVHGELTITQESDSDYITDGNPSGLINKHSAEHWVQVSYNGSGSLLLQKVWREGEAWLGQTSAGWAWCSTVGVAQTENGTKYPVWTERLWSTAPSESNEGTPIGWRLHGHNWSFEVYHTENESLLCFPKFSQSSDRFIYITDLKLCDPRMESTIVGLGGIGYDWCISHDGDFWWPTRIVNGADPYDADKRIDAVADDMLTDCIKDSSIELAPATDQWPNRQNLWWDVYTEPITTWTVNTAASYVSNKLTAATGVTDSDSIELSLSADIQITKLDRFRVLVRAKAVEKNWLMFQWDNVLGIGLHARAWMNLATGLAVSSENVASFERINDLGDGVYEYAIVIERCGINTGSTNIQRLRLVNNNDETVFSGNVNEGLEIYTAIISRQCADCTL